MSRVKTLSSFAMFLGWISVAAGAPAEPELTYPELLVTPRASERAEMEAKREADSPWTRFVPLQISAATTITAALMHQGTPANPGPGGTKNTYARTAGMLVGGGWLAATLAMSALYRPYEGAQTELAGLPRKTAREQLARERLAEEALQAPARLLCRLNWINAASNLGVGAFMFVKADRQMDQVMSGLVALAGFTPVIFPSRMQRVAREQERYKKRIYGPIVSLDGRIAPGLSFSLTF